MKKNLLLSILLICTCLVSYGQVKVSGKVISSDDGSGIPGVTVLLKGSKVGTQTDVEGKYSIEAKKEDVLVFSFVGMNTQEVTVGEQTSVNVSMSSDDNVLSEVVVTAQGIVREKKALGYAVTSVDKKSIEDRPQADVGRVLQGKIPGVNITSTSGVSGTGTNIIIRGYSSISGSNQPLFVVDGVPFNSNTNTRTTSTGGAAGFTGGGQSSSSRFLDLDPNNIENVTVLKGLAAAVTYGDQGRNGVILVTTKNGSKKARETRYTVTQSYFTNTANLPNYQNKWVGGFQQNLGYFFSNWGPTIEEAKLYPSQNTNAGLTNHPYAFLSNLALRAGQADYVASVSPYQMQVFPNNISDFFRTGQISNTSLNISGGGEKVGFNVSGGYNKEQGYIPGNGLTKINLGLGLNAQLSKKITMNSSINFANTSQFSPPISGGTGNNALDFPSVLANVMYTPRQVDLMGWPYEDPTTGASVYFRSGNDIVNPRWVLNNYFTKGNVNRVFTANTVTYDVAKDLTMIFRSGLDTYTDDQEFSLNKGGVQVPTGSYNTINFKNTIWNHDLILSYSKALTSDFTLAAKVGGNIRSDKFALTGISSQNQLARNLFRHNNFIDNVAFDFITEQNRMGVYGEITADYKNFLFLNFQGRNDWNSALEQANRSIFYPSVSASFLPFTAFKGLESEFLGALKIRAGYGTSAGFPAPYQTRSILNQSARGWLNSTGAAVSTHSVDNFLGNPNLKPELITENELGLEGKLLNNRVNFDLTYYRRDTKNLITRSPLDPSTGFTATTINIGKIRNEGWEASLSGTALKTKDFGWDVTFNYSRNTPTTLDLGGLTEVQVGDGFSDLGNFAIVGRPFNMIKGSGFRRNEKGELLIDSGGYLQATASPIELGDPNPAFITSLINSFSYKGFSLDVMMAYRHGGAIYSATAGALMGRGLIDTGFDRAQTLIFPGVKADGSVNDIQVTAADVTFNNLYFFGAEGRMFDGSTIRLQEVSLGYSIPKKLLGKSPFKGVNLAFTANNLWYRALAFPKDINFDTDNLGLGVGNAYGFDYLVGPSAKRVGGTLKLTF
jgi:TonB-linked SusC/RagA family outer membrane protein